MTWVDIRKWLYVPLLFALVAATVATVVIVPEQYRMVAALAAVAVLLVPGAIGRWLLRDLLASRAYIARGQFAEALAAAERFLAGLALRPWIRHAIWTQYGMYTQSVEAMASNNAGAALLEMRRIAEARGMFARARRCDGMYPIPVYNLAVIAKLEGNELESEKLAEEAAKLGFGGGRLDVIVGAIGVAYARLATPL